MLTLRLLLLLPAVLLCAQAPSIPSPAAVRTVHDVRDRLTFQLPLGWPLSTRDRELSTFHQEARSAPRSARLRFVAAMPENPYPESTFSGAHFYLSTIPGQTAAQCAAQAGPAAARTWVADRPALWGHDEHGTICTQFRDEVYTLQRSGACLRIDLALNNFCGGEVSGVRDLTPAQIQAVQQRLKAILDSIRFDR